MAALQESIDASALTVVLRSQRSPRDTHFARLLASKLQQQGVPGEQIHLLHREELLKNEDDNSRGYWTLMTYLHKLFRKRQTPWYLFLEPNTLVHVGKLIARLRKSDSAQKLWLGHRIETIGSVTQDYATGRPYPLAPSGFVMSRALIQVKRIDPITCLWQTTATIASCTISLLLIHVFAGFRLLGRHQRLPT